MSTTALRLTCPHCGYEEFPVRHTNGTDCGGVFVQSWAGWKCNDCGSSGTGLKCDECGQKLNFDDVEEDEYHGQL